MVHGLMLSSRNWTASIKEELVAIMTMSMGLKFCLQSKHLARLVFGLTAVWKFSAQWASKSKQIVIDSGFDVQKGYDCVDGDVVSEHSEEIRRKVSFCHDSVSYGS